MKKQRGSVSVVSGCVLLLSALLVGGCNSRQETETVSTGTPVNASLSTTGQTTQAPTSTTVAPTNAGLSSLPPQAIGVAEQQNRAGEAQRQQMDAMMRARRAAEQQGR